MSEEAHEILLVVLLIGAKHFFYRGHTNSGTVKNTWNAVYSVTVYEEINVYIHQKETKGGCLTEAPQQRGAANETW